MRKAVVISDVQAIEVQIPREVAQYTGWFLVFGIGLLLLGTRAHLRRRPGKRPEFHNDSIRI